MAPGREEPWRRHRTGWMLEVELATELYDAWIVGGGNLSEIRIGGVSIEAVIASTAELGVVEHVERLEP